MSLAAVIILTIHYTLLFALSSFGLHRLSMAFRWYFHRNYKPNNPDSFSELPRITIQIPIYNEKFVAARSIKAACNIRYPKDKLQIQIVDDSNDSTSSIIADHVADFQAQGFDIQHVQRSNRNGYKAGGLKNAMKHTTGEFIAIFDADFVPTPDLLLDTIHYFTDPEIGMLQFRWEHLNRQSSKLTETQAILLDAHFALEQHVRAASDLFLNFNGTAGMWRSATIIDAGHWSADTLTEDLDLSYRAQLRGWKMCYLNHISCAGEIPTNLNAFKSQQHRWAKGGIEVMKKMLRKVWSAPVSIKRKLESTFHLTNNLAYLFMLVDTIFFLIPAIIIRDHYSISQHLWLDIPLLIAASGGHLIYLITGQVALKHSLGSALCSVPRLLLVGIELAFNNASAALEALMSKRSPFVRTPKNGDVSSDKAFIDSQIEPATLSKVDQSSVANKEPLGQYRTSTPSIRIYIESSLVFVYLLLFMWAAQNQHYYILPFALFLMLGFSRAASANFRDYLSNKNMANKQAG